MNLYAYLPSSIQPWVRHWLIMPGKRLVSRGVIEQEGFVLAKRLDQSIPFQLVREGCYEPHLSRLLQQYLNPGDCFIDVGANIGYFTLLAAACVGPQGEVHSFEPNPHTFKALKQNVALNGFGQVSLNNLALSNQRETIRLWFGAEIDSGLASMRQTNRLLTQSTTCQAITLDSYIAEKELKKVRAMKLDIEGAEFLALQGAKNLLQGPNKPDLITLELIQSHMAAFGLSPHTIIQLLTECGYKLQQLIEYPTFAFHLDQLDVTGNLPDMTLVAVSGE